MNAVVGCEKVVNNSGSLGKAESVTTLEEEEEFFDALEEQESIYDLEEREEFFDSKAAAFNVPLSIFHYKDYDSDFFTSWYNISSEIFKEINRACPERQALNLALSVLMFPYIVFTALGLAVYNRSKTNDKTQISSEEKKTKKSEVSESTAKRLAYGVLASIAVLVSIPILLLFLIPATPALATFYLLNRKLSHSLIDVLKVSGGLYKNEHQNIEVSFREIDAGKSDIMWDMEVKFPPQFKQLLRDLYEDPEHNAVLKLSANIHLKNGLKPLRNEIKNVLATSIQEFAKTMEELMKLEKKDITYDKLKELLNEFRLKVVSSIDSKLTTHLIYNAYQVAFIQAIKFQREKDYLLEDELKNTLVKQELESQGKELPSEKEITKQTLKNLGKENKITKSRIIDVCESMHPKETAEALRKAEETIKELKGMGEERYRKIHEELKEVYENRKDSNLKDDALKRRLEDLFKFEYNDQEVERRLIKSVMKKAKVVLSQSGVLDKGLMERLKQSMWNLLGTSNKDKNLMERLEDLEKEIKIPLSEENLKETSDKVNDFIEEVYSEIVKHKVQNLFKQQKKMLLENIEDLMSSLNKPKGMYNSEDNKVTLLFDRRLEDILHLEKECLEQKEYDLLKEKIEKQSEDIRKSMRDDKDLLYFLDKDLMDIHLDSNGKFIKLLEQLEPGKGELLINEKTTNDYREELESCEKIKFAIIEDDLLKAFEHETFNEEAVKKLLEEAEFEYYLAERCIKYPVIKTKDNMKHFSQNLLSPLIDRLVENIVNNVPKSDKSSWLQPIRAIQTGLGYIKTGLAIAIYGDKSTEGKALSVAHDTHKEVETFLQCFQSNYEGVGAFLGNLFSDDGETFKNDVWPKVEEHLHGMWDRFFKDIEFKIGNRLDEVSVTQQKQKTMIVAQ